MTKFKSKIKEEGKVKMFLCIHCCNNFDTPEVTPGVKETIV